MDELGRWHVDLLVEDRPVGVIEIKNRHGRDQVHVGLVVGIYGSNISPVGLVSVGSTGNLVECEVVDTTRPSIHKGWDDVSTHIVG